MADDMLLMEKRGRVCTLILNCPKKRNALSEKVLLALRFEIERLSRDDDICAIVIRGAGEEAFCSGYDIGALTANDRPEGAEPEGRSDPFAAFEAAVEAIQNYPYPVIAMLNGYAFGGGCELTVSCDLRIGGDHIRIGMTPAKIGMIYTPNGLMRFIRTIGLAKTKEIFFTGRIYDARAAREMGLLDYLVPTRDLEAFTYDLAQEIAANAPLSLKGIKRIINLIHRSGHQMAADDVKEANEIVSRVLHSRDLKEGQAAFLEKRPPQFRGL
jgi:enoyl-CoA hydratase/carnithine racemase